MSLNTNPVSTTALLSHPLLWLVPVTATAGLFGVRECLMMKLSGAAFVSSAVFAVGLVSSSVLGLAR